MLTEKYDIRELVEKVFDGDLPIRKYGSLLTIYYSNLDMRNVASDHLKKVVAIVIAHYFSIQLKATLIEKIETTYTQKIIKQLCLMSPKCIGRNKLKLLLESHNWTSFNLIPYTMIGLDVSPLFWYSQLEIVANQNLSSGHQLVLKQLEVITDADKVPVEPLQLI